jgi:hypothetical protein
VTRTADIARQKRPLRRGAPLPSALLLLAAAAWLLAAGPAAAQVADDPDSTVVEEAAGGLLQQAAQAADQMAQQPDAPPVEATVPDLGFFLGIANKPKAGVKANVRQNTLYGELETTLSFARQSSFRNLAEWSFEDFRSQNKTIEKRKSAFTYGFGQYTPFTLSLKGLWDWSDDETVNTTGFTNVIQIQNRNLGLEAKKTKFQLGGLTHSVRAGALFEDHASVNLNQQNQFQETTADAGVQSGWEIREGLVTAGRLYGTATEGERLLGQTTSPSSARGDTVGLGMYFSRGSSVGRVSLTRSNFRKKYLDFRRNSNGLVDTTNVAESDKVVNELETKDAMTLDFESKFRLGRFGVEVKASRTTDDQDYASSGIGLKERLQDKVNTSLSYAAGRDSFVVMYRYGWSWDDQRIKDATANRGRQYLKDRDYQFNWYRLLFQDTQLNLQYHQGLVQDIAENRHNENDKDRLSTDFSGQLDRVWPNSFRARMTFSYRRNEDLQLRASRSSNNNIKDSYELTPSYGWTVNEWIAFDQNYRLYIQYTDYVYSYLESVRREDDYNKRGNLTTKVTLTPTDRLTVVVRHDYNKRFNATKSGTDAAGNTFYRRDQNQTISTIDLAVDFNVAKGVSLEASTFRTRDDRVTMGSRVTETRNDSGEMVVGARVNRRWGRTRPLELSAMIKKFNAFGPSVTATSADYWEADVWLKWEF